MAKSVNTLADYSYIAESRRRPLEDVERWTSGDTALQAVFGLALLGDYLQTRKIVRDADEMNPIIGLTGQRVPPAVYFPAVMALHTAAMYALPKRYRTIAQGLSIGAQAGVVGRNLVLGYGFKW